LDTNATPTDSNKKGRKSKTHHQQRKGGTGNGEPVLQGKNKEAGNGITPTWGDGNPGGEQRSTEIGDILDSPKKKDLKNGPLEDANG